MLPSSFLLRKTLVLKQCLHGEEAGSGTDVQIQLHPRSTDLSVYAVISFITKCVAVLNS